MPKRYEALKNAGQLRFKAADVAAEYQRKLDGIEDRPASPRDRNTRFG
jgi:hypothetical protein